RPLRRPLPARCRPAGDLNHLGFDPSRRAVVRPRISPFFRPDSAKARRFEIVASMIDHHMFPRQVALSPADLLIFRLITSLTPFFFGFEVPATIGLFIPGRWITFAEANAYHLRNAVNFFRDGSLQIWDATFCILIQ